MKTHTFISLRCFFLVSALISSCVWSASSYATAAEITNQNLPQIARWLRSLSSDNPPSSAFVGQKVELKGRYIFNENTGNLEVTDQGVRYAGRPERGNNWSGVVIRDGFNDVFVSWVHVYCSDSASYQDEMITMSERKAENRNVPSLEVEATVTGTVLKGAGSIGDYQVVLEPGCSLTFDVPAWIDEHVANAARLKVSPALAKAALETEAAESWKVKANFVFFRQAMLADGVVDEEELNLFHVMFSSPGMYIFEAEGLEPVRFRNYWVPSRFDSNTMRYLNSLGLFYSQITAREVTTTLDQALQIGWKEKPADVALVHRGYNGNNIERTLTYSLVVGDLVILMQESTPSNAYGPIRAEISQWFATLNTIENEEERKAILESLWYLTDQAARQARYKGHNVPDFLYSWIKPK